MNEFDELIHPDLNRPNEEKFSLKEWKEKTMEEMKEAHTPSQYVPVVKLVPREQLVQDDYKPETKIPEAGGGGSGGGAIGGSGDRYVYVIDGMKFVSALKERKRKLRTSYVESKQKGAKIFRYIDYTNLFKIIAESVIEICVEDIELIDVPALLEHTFEVNKVEVYDDDEEGGEGGGGGGSGSGSGGGGGGGGGGNKSSNKNGKNRGDTEYEKWRSELPQ